MVRKESIIAGFLFHPQGKCDSGEKNWKLLPDFLRAHQPGALSCCPASGPDGERQLSCSEKSGHVGSIVVGPNAFFWISPLGQLNPKLVEGRRRNSSTRSWTLCSKGLVLPTALCRRDPFPCRSSFSTT